MTTRTCRSCKQPFATAESIRTHKRDMLCRPVDVLLAIGWRKTPKGWIPPTTPSAPYASRKAQRRS